MMNRSKFLVKLGALNEKCYVEQRVFIVHFIINMESVLLSSLVALCTLFHSVQSKGGRTGGTYGSRFGPSGDASVNNDGLSVWAVIGLSLGGILAISFLFFCCIYVYYFCKPNSNNNRNLNKAPSSATNSNHLSPYSQYRRSELTSPPTISSQFYPPPPAYSMVHH